MKYLFIIFFVLLSSPVFGDSFDNTEWGTANYRIKFNEGNIIIADQVGQYRAYDKGTLGEGYLRTGDLVFQFKFRIIKGQLRLFVVTNNKKFNKENGFPDISYYERIK